MTKTAEKLQRKPVVIPACRCRHSHAAHTYGEGTTGLRLGPCKECHCQAWYPGWHDRYRALRQVGR